MHTKNLFKGDSTKNPIFVDLQFGNSVTLSRTKLGFFKIRSMKGGF